MDSSSKQSEIVRAQEETNKALARLYTNPDFRVYRNWLESEITQGFNRMLKKRKEETMKELAAEIKAYRTCISKVELCFKAVRQEP